MRVPAGGLDADAGKMRAERGRFAGQTRAGRGPDAGRRSANLFLGGTLPMIGVLICQNARLFSDLNNGIMQEICVWVSH